MISFSLPIFLYAAIFTKFHFFIQYIVLLALYYVFLFIVVFSTQKLLFRYLKRVVVIGDILIYLFGFIVVAIPIALHIAMLSMSSKSDFLSSIMIYSGLSVLVIIISWFLKRLFYKNT